jgi:predicted RNA-binding protein with PIN domain
LPAPEWEDYLKRVILIDGYNVIFGDSDLRKTYHENQDLGRNKLLEVVSRYATKGSVRAIVVFDGGDTDEGRVHLPSPVNVETVFVGDADQYIRRRVSDSGRVETLTVVSSDEGHVARFSRRIGVEVIRVEEFMQKLLEMDRRETKFSDKPGGETRAGVEYWLKKFGSRGEE